MTTPNITDVCLVTRDLDAAVAFYTRVLGYRLDSRMPGFADFRGPGPVLAVWDAEQIRRNTGVPTLESEPAGRTVMLAVELPSPGDVDATYRQLVARGVEFYRPPRDYPWNARCVYMPGPCGEFWEFFAWHEGGRPGRAAALPH